MASRQSHDYTEGASAVDIADALATQQRQRRASLHSTFYDGDDGAGAGFDGPGSAAVPSSVSRMGAPRSWARRPSVNRRASGDSARSAGMESQAFLSDDDEDGEEDGERGRAQEPARHGVFESISHFFGGPSRPELHRRSSRSTHRSRSRGGSEYGLDEADSGDSRWGYSSGEEDSEDEVVRAESPTGNDDGSYPPTPEEGLPALASGAMFGDEARIDLDGVLDDLSAPPPGPPSRQNVYVADEDSHLRFLGFETILWRLYVWRAGCVVTLGALGLLGHWFPRLWLSWTAHEKAFKDTKQGFVVIEVGSYPYVRRYLADGPKTAHRDVAIFPMRELEYPHPLSTVFKSETESTSSRRPSVTSKSVMGSQDDEMLETLRVVDYRYSRFALNPRTGLFAPVRCVVFRTSRVPY
jgi:cation-transporting ATPase 13A2